MLGNFKYLRNLIDQKFDVLVLEYDRVYGVSHLMGDGCVDQLFEGDLGFDLVVEDRLRDINELDDNVLGGVVLKQTRLNLNEPEISGFRSVVLVVIPELLFGGVDLLRTEYDENFSFKDFHVFHFQDILDG